MSTCKYCGRDRTDANRTCPGCGSSLVAAALRVAGCPIMVNGERYITCYECKNGMPVDCPIAAKEHL